MLIVIVALILAVLIVNFLYKLFMSIIGANVMLFNPVTKISLYIMVWMLLVSAFVS